MGWLLLLTTQMPKETDKFVLEVILVVIQGRNTFMGYFKNEVETKNTIDNKGFVHSGDVGKVDFDGNLTITGRIKELIITAGG